MSTTKENLALWVAWLRDPANRQDRELLRTNDGFCCLGGACQVYTDVTGNGEWTFEDGWKFSIESSLGRPIGYADLPPSRVGSFFGLGDNNPCFRIHVDCLEGAEEDGDDDGAFIVTATSLNDTYGWTFAQIADVIEAQLINLDGDGTSFSARHMPVFRLSE